MNKAKTFNEDIERNTPDFNEELHSGLAQPIENRIGNADELLGTMIDSTYGKVPKEQIFQRYSIKEQKETQNIIEEYRGTLDSVLEQIKKPQTNVSNIGIIGDVDHSKSSKSKKILSEHLLKKQKRDSIGHDYNDKLVNTFEIYNKLKKGNNTEDFKIFKKTIKSYVIKLLNEIEKKLSKGYPTLGCGNHYVSTIINFGELLEDTEKKELKIDKLKKLYKSHLIENLYRWNREKDEIYSRKYLFQETYIFLINIGVTEKEIGFSINYLNKIVSEIKEEKKHGIPKER